MKNYKFQIFVSVWLLFGLFSAAHAAGQILRNADGSIRYFGPFESRNACPAGTHLPTTRELAQELQARGAKGILELNQANPNMVPDGYYKVSAINPDGRQDEFYFSPIGYLRALDDFGNNLFWSSSVQISYFGYEHIYRLDGRTGLLGAGIGDPHYRGDAVLCMPGR